MKLDFRGRRRRDRRRSRARRLVALGLSVLPEVVVLRLRGYRPAGKVVVRCRSGHLFTTLWVPGVSVKSVRLGPWRGQRCPVGRHWSIVSPVRLSDLTEAERQAARERSDIPLP